MHKKNLTQISRRQIMTNQSNFSLCQGSFFLSDEWEQVAVITNLYENAVKEKFSVTHF